MKDAPLIKQYRRLSPVVEAVQLTRDNVRAVERWSAGQVVCSPVLEHAPDNPSGVYAQITTPEGIMIAIPGDWVIKGVMGEFYSCDPGVFARTYGETTGQFLWLLTAKEDLPKDDNPWSHYWDRYFGFVVRAPSQAKARLLAARRSRQYNGDEGYRVWLNPAYTTCVALSPEGPAEIIMLDYRPG